MCGQALKLLKNCNVSFHFTVHQIMLEYELVLLTCILIIGTKRCGYICWSPLKGVLECVVFNYPEFVDIFVTFVVLPF